jgi:phosphomannomutase
MEART